MAPREEFSAAATQLRFPNVLVLRHGFETSLCRVGRKQVWVPRGVLPGSLSQPGDTGVLVIERGLAHDLGAPDRPVAETSSPLANATDRRLLWMADTDTAPRAWRLGSAPPGRSIIGSQAGNAPADLRTPRVWVIDRSCSIFISRY